VIPHLARGTGDNDWNTPGQCISAARAVLGEIDLDPASNIEAQTIVQATKFFTKEDDGLKHEWHGRVWLNPPYARGLIGRFVAKLLAELEAGHVTAAIMLTHSFTDTAWYQDAAGMAAAVCFTRGRIRFEKPAGEKASPVKGQSFLYFGDNPNAFRDVFEKYGWVGRIVHADEARGARRSSGSFCVD
jgi:phage N-6-adenine-methyltransferase